MELSPVALFSTAITLSYAGQFDPLGGSECNIARVKLGKPDVSVNLLVDIFNNPDVITGTIGNGDWLSINWMDRNVYTTNLLATNFNGKYTLLISGW